VSRPYRLTPEARLDLLSLWEFIARDNISAADRVAERLANAFRSLARFPRKGHARSDLHTSDEVLFWPVGSYVVVYRPEPKPILIVRIIHGARDLDALL
jgi:plasmid stabilization system protein ParE